MKHERLLNPRQTIGWRHALNRRNLPLIDIHGERGAARNQLAVK